MQLAAKSMNRQTKQKAYLKCRNYTCLKLIGCEMYDSKQGRQIFLTL